MDADALKEKVDDALPAHRSSSNHRCHHLQSRRGLPTAYTNHVETTKRHDDDDGPFASSNNKGPSVILATGTHWAFWPICTLIRASSIYALSGGIRSTTL